MNWKNVLRLISVDMKSGRLIRGQRLRKYIENRLFPYVLYGGSCLLGLAIGWLIGTFYSSVSDTGTKAMIHQAALNVFLALPTIVLAYSLVFSMMSQIQRSGVRASIQPPYWLPITWEEHTLASTLASLLGVPLASIVLIGSAISVASMFLEEGALGVLTIFALVGSAFLASNTTEIYRILQVRLVGAVYKSSGKAAVWVRFIGTLLFLLVFYIVWFSLTSGAGAAGFIETVARGQEAIWFIPYVWLGMTVAFFAEGLYAHVVILSLASLLFILALFYVAVRLNMKFGLYEPPAITVSRGTYAPRVGLLGRLGFSSLEAAVVRKDFRAFTRRRELMYVFIMPIVFILMPIMQYSGVLGTPVEAGPSRFLLAWILLVPGAIMAIMLGAMIIGEEGESVWLFFSSPITARSLVKSKYAFVIIFSFIVTLVCGTVGVLVAHPSLDIAMALFVEALLLVFALGAVSLGAGIKGADFTEAPRPRMVRPLTALINGLLCLGLAVAIFAPLLLHAVTTGYIAATILHIPAASLLPKLDLSLAVAISAAIALVVTVVFYWLALQHANEFLKKAEI